MAWDAGTLQIRSCRRCLPDMFGKYRIYCRTYTVIPFSCPNGVYIVAHILTYILDVPLLQRLNTGLSLTNWKRHMVSFVGGSGPGSECMVPKEDISKISSQTLGVQK